MGFGIGAMIGSSILGGIMGNRATRRANQRLTNWYNKAKEPTQAELELEAKLKREKEFGDPDLEQKRQELYRPIFSYGKEARADATGVAIRQGLENSIIASEMKNKVDAKTYQMIDEQADKILAHNKAWKKDAEDRYMMFKLKRDERLRNLAMQYEGGLQDSTPMADTLLGLGSSLLGSYGKSQISWLNSSGDAGGSDLDWDANIV